MRLNAKKTKTLYSISAVCVSFYNQSFTPKVNGLQFQPVWGTGEIQYTFIRLFFLRRKMRGDVKKAISSFVVFWAVLTPAVHRSIQNRFWHVCLPSSAQNITGLGPEGSPTLWRHKGQLLTRSTRSMTVLSSLKYQSFCWRHVGEKQCFGNAQQTDGQIQVHDRITIFHLWNTSGYTAYSGKPGSRKHVYTSWFLQQIWLTRRNR